MAKFLGKVGVRSVLSSVSVVSLGFLGGMIYAHNNEKQILRNNK